MILKTFLILLLHKQFWNWIITSFLGLDTILDFQVLMHYPNHGIESENWYFIRHHSSDLHLQWLLVRQGTGQKKGSSKSQNQLWMILMLMNLSPVDISRLCWHVLCFLPHCSNSSWESELLPTEWSRMSMAPRWWFQPHQPLLGSLRSSWGYNPAPPLLMWFGCCTWNMGHQNPKPTTDPSLMSYKMRECPNPESFQNAKYKISS